jgi:hypothetical protein
MKFMLTTWAENGEKMSESTQLSRAGTVLAPASAHIAVYDELRYGCRWSSIGKAFRCGRYISTDLHFIDDLFQLLQARAFSSAPANVTERDSSMCISSNRSRRSLENVKLTDDEQMLPTAFRPASDHYDGLFVGISGNRNREKIWRSNL